MKSRTHDNILDCKNNITHACCCPSERPTNNKTKQYGSILYITVRIIPSGELLNDRHVFISHGLKDMFNNKFIILPCLNHISKKGNVSRISHHKKKDLQ